MFYLMIDTCVLLDIARDYRERPMLDALDDLVASENTKLIVPQTIVDEFERNKDRILEQSNRSLSGALKRAKDAVDRFGDPRKKRTVLNFLNDVDHKIPSLGEATSESIQIIQDLFRYSYKIELTDQIKLRAAQRAIDNRAPFHRNKNSINDAILIECYDEARMHLNSSGDRFAFITHNTKDFSDNHLDKRKPHPDFADCFTRVKSRYFISLGECLRCVDPELVSDILIEYEWEEEPRNYTEIGQAIDDLVEKIWYDRHQMRKTMIEQGRMKIVPNSTSAEDAGNDIHERIWEGALAAAEETEAKFGKDSLGPYTDFEWGMLNGKLSALRWALGDEWDMLDT